MRNRNREGGEPLRRVVCASGRGAVTIADRDVSVGSLRATVDRVVPLGAECDEELYEAEVHRLVERLHDGVSGCVIVAGGVASERTRGVQGEGGVGSGGIIERAIRGVWDGAQRSRRAGAETTISMSFVELFDEVITDLLQLEAEEIPRGAGAHAVRGVQRMRHAELGVEQSVFDDCGPTVSNIAIPMGDADETIEAFRKGLKRQHHGVTDEGSAVDRATRVLTLEVRRTGGGGGGGGGGDDDDGDDGSEQVARFIVAEPPASDFLRNAAPSASGSDPLKSIADGRPSRLARSIATVTAVAREGSEFPPFHISSFTHLLTEAIGGNCSTIVVGFLEEEESRGGAAAVTLNFVQGFLEIETFPVRMRGAVVGLLRRQRRQCMMLRDKLALSRGAHTADADAALVRLRSETGTDKAALEKKLMESAQALSEQTQLAAQNWEKCEKLEKNYRELVQRKDEVSMEHIAAEEQRLKVSRALIDLRQEMTRQHEEADELEYRLVSKQLALENTIVELEQQEQEMVKHIADLEAEAAVATKTSHETNFELTTMRNDTMKIRSEREEAQGKNETLGTELLTLVNAQEVMRAELARLAKQSDATREDAEQAQGDAEVARADAAKARVECHKQTQLAEQFMTGKMKAELELERAVIEFKAKKLGLDTESSQYHLQSESQLLETRRAAEAASRAASLKLEAKMEEIRNAEELLTRAQSEIATVTTEESQLRLALQHTESRLAESVEQTNAALAKIEAEQAERSEVEAKLQTQLAESAAAAAASLEKDAALREEDAQLRHDSAELGTKLALAERRYKRTWKRAKALADAAGVQLPPLVEGGEEGGQGGVDAHVTAEEDDDDEAGRYLAELTQTRKRLFEAERAARLLRDARESESAAMTGKTAEAQLKVDALAAQQQDAERQLEAMATKMATTEALLSGDAASLQASLEETVANGEAERGTLMLRAEAAEDAAAKATEENVALQTRLAEVRVLQGTLVAQIKRVQQETAAKEAASPPARQITVLDLERQRKQGASMQRLRDEAAALRQENTRLQEKTDSAVAAATAAASAAAATGGSGGGGAALHELRRVTTQLLEEQTKRAVAEEKLRRFQERMRTTTEELRFLKKRSAAGQS